MPCLRSSALLALVATVAGCGSLPTDRVYKELGKGSTPAIILAAEDDAPADAAPLQPPPRRVEPSPARPEVEYYDPGSGKFLRSPATAAPPPKAEGDVTLNFENANLLEVIKIMLRDLLGYSYIVDPQVQGSVTLDTTQPMRREDVLPTLETLLRMNGAALVRRGNTFEVVPVESAVQGRLTPQLGGGPTALPRGYGVRVVPLRFVSAEEMREILEPFAPPASVVRADENRNLLVLAGTGAELDGLMETVRLFDVDWLNGMSIALFTPSYVDAKTLADELSNVFPTSGSGSPLSGLLRIIPIERLDAVLVITPQPQYLAKVRDWVERLDRDTGAVGQRLYIYKVENGKASDIAEVLTQVFEDDDGQRLRAAELAPGLESVRLESAEPSGEATGGEQASTSAAQPAASAGSAATDGVSIESGPVKIIADDINNALVIKATASQYRQIVQALRELDAVPLQVLIEATIAEVRLTGNLSLGLQWFFNNNVGGKDGFGTLDLGASATVADTLVPGGGFTYALATGSGALRAVLNTLASESKLNVVSSPSLMVLNNQEASIQVGDEVPVTTQRQQSVDTSTANNVLQNVEFRETGVLLNVTPRVNPGGLVVLEVEQEVSNVAPGTDTNLTPTIQQRKISSTVAVQSGETIVLGGLIRDNARNTVDGIPGLVDVPVLGALFGSTIEEAERTELVVLITPRAVQGVAQAREVTRAFRDKMDSLKPFENGDGFKRDFGPLRSIEPATEP